MIVLDTHVVIWWVNGDLERLSVTAREAIDQACSVAAAQNLLVSAISCWEVAMLVQRGRLALSMDCDRWLTLLSAIAAVELVPLTPTVAVTATQLPGDFHADPADRFLVALARQRNIPLVTADSKIRDYPHVQTLW